MPDLSLNKKAQKLRIYIGESDRWRGKSLDAALLETLRQEGMSGASVFRSVAGFGANSRIHTTHIESLSFDLTILIETVDTPEKIASVLDVIYPMVREGLITIEDVRIVKYTHRSLNPLPADKLVSEVMTSDVLSLQADMSVLEAWTVMLKNRIKALPVTDSDGKVVGILTDEDLIDRAGIQQRVSVAIRMDKEEINQELQSLQDSELKVKDVMTHPAVTVLKDNTLGAATACMVKSGLKRLPVVDKEGELVGVLSRIDVLRQVAESPYALPTPELLPGAVRTVADIMRIEIPMVTQDDDLASMIEKFAQTNSHRLIVIDAEGKVTGLVSDSDVIARVQPSKRSGILAALRNIGKPPPGKETAADLMSHGALTVSPDMPVVDALNLMLGNSRKWMVVVDEENHPLGLVDRQRMLMAMAVFDLG